MTKLTVTDIADTREYERNRDSFRSEIIALKKLRRVGVGPFVTMVFENRETIRFQIQEMARAERIATDEGIQTELDIYNPLIPEPGQLSATLFLELTTDEQLREWLPKLVGIETAPELHFDGQRVACTVDPAHAEQLTRDHTTASVHYVHFHLTPEQVQTFSSAEVSLAVAHKNYTDSTVLSAESRDSLVADLRGS